MEGMPTEICIRFGKTVRRLRLQRGWRQIDLATHAELAKSYVSELETARREPCLNTIDRIAKALGVSASELMQDN